MHHPSNIVAICYVITTQFGAAPEFIGVEKLTHRCGRSAASWNSASLYIRKAGYIGKAGSAKIGRPGLAAPHNDGDRPKTRLIDVGSSLPQPSPAQPSAFRRPGLVITGRRRPRIGGQGRARRTPGLRRAGHIRQMRQFPRAGGVILRCWRTIGRVMQPAVPAGRGHRALALARINHPAPFEAQRLVDLPGTIITVAGFVLADEFAEEQCVQRRIYGLAVPPGENPTKPFHVVAQPSALRERPVTPVARYEQTAAACPEDKRIDVGHMDIRLESRTRGARCREAPLEWPSRGHDGPARPTRASARAAKTN